MVIMYIHPQFCESCPIYHAGLTPLQGVLFYVPHWLWKNWEGGKIKMISTGLRGFTAEGKENRKDNHERLIQYIWSALHTHDGYAFGYFFCEILNFANVVSEMLEVFILSMLQVSSICITQKVRKFKIFGRRHLIHVGFCSSWNMETATRGFHSMLYKHII